MGYQANIAEENGLLGAFLHIFEVAFWVDEWSTEFGHHRPDDAHVHDHSPLPMSIRRCCAAFLELSTIPFQLVAKLVDHFDVLLDQ